MALSRTVLLDNLSRNSCMYVEGPHVYPCNSRLGGGTGTRGERLCRGMGIFQILANVSETTVQSVFASQRVV